MTDNTSVPACDDVDVLTALAVYDNLIDAERRELFTSTYRAVLADGRGDGGARLESFAHSLRSMVVLESRHPEARDRIRNAARTSAEAGGSVPFEDVYAVLRGGPRD